MVIYSDNLISKVESAIISPLNSTLTGFYIYDQSFIRMSRQSTYINGKRTEINGFQGI